MRDQVIRGGSKTRSRTRTCIVELNHNRMFPDVPRTGTNVKTNAVSRQNQTKQQAKGTLTAEELDHLRAITTSEEEGAARDNQSRMRTQDLSLTTRLRCE